MVELSGLTKTFGDRLAVDDLTLSVAGGEIFGLLGPNGAGKSTTMKMLIGLVSPTAGSARVAGHDVVADALEVKRLTGYVPDTPHLFEDLTGRDYIELCAESRGIPLDEVPGRIDPMLAITRLVVDVDRPMGQYSFGTRKKLALVAALMFRPRVLLLDEPTAGLDPGAMRAMEQLLVEAAAGGAAVLLSTHQIPWIRAISRRIGIMHAGRLLAEATPDQLDTLMTPAAPPPGDAAASPLGEAWRKLFDEQGS
jgi:ABC-2 type transport system ATP-binding protein